jgi:hypothetical protein
MTMDQIMKILHIEEKGPKLNTLERFHICDMTKKGLQMNDTFTDMHNPIFDILIKTHIQPPPITTHNTNLPPPHTNRPHTVYKHTRAPQQAVHIVLLQQNNTTTTENCVCTQLHIRTCKYMR